MSNKLTENQVVRKLINMSPELAARVDEYRWKNRVRSESEVLRQLITAGLDSFSQDPLTTPVPLDHT